jgi:hypothetical protein
MSDEIKTNKKDAIFFLVLFFLMMYSIGAAYYKYILQEDFAYFLAEEDVPDQFDMNAYLE